MLPGGDGSAFVPRPLGGRNPGTCPRLPGRAEMKGVVGFPSLNPASSAEILPVPGFAVTRGLGGRGAEDANPALWGGFFRPRPGQGRAPSAFATSHPAGRGCRGLRCQQNRSRRAWVSSAERDRVLRELGEAFPGAPRPDRDGPSGRTATARRAGPTRGRLTPAAISPCLTRLARAVAAPLLCSLPSPRSRVYSLLFCFLSRNTAADAGEAGRRLLFKSSALKDARLAKTFPGICKI